MLGFHVPAIILAERFYSCSNTLSTNCINSDTGASRNSEKALFSRDLPICPTFEFNPLQSDERGLQMSIPSRKQNMDSNNNKTFEVRPLRLSVTSLHLLLLFPLWLLKVLEAFHFSIVVSNPLGTEVPPRYPAASIWLP
jgi:hypothetical protein